MSSLNCGVGASILTKVNEIRKKRVLALIFLLNLRGGDMVEAILVAVIANLITHYLLNNR